MREIAKLEQGKLYSTKTSITNCITTRRRLKPSSQCQPSQSTYKQVIHTPERTSMPKETKEKWAPLEPRATFYCWANLIISGLAFFIFLLTLTNLLSSTDTGDHKLGYAIIAFLSFVGCLTFASRFFWIRLIPPHRYRVTDDSSDFSLERTTGFAWLLLFIITFLQTFFSIKLDDLGLETINGWIVALALWTPIVSIIGPSWGKLKATDHHGKEIAWPNFRWQGE